MRLPPFELLQPETLEEAIAATGRDDDTRLIGGGTALVPMMRLGLVRPERVVSLHRVPGLAAIAVDGDVLHAGAMVSVADLARDPAVRRGWPLLAEAAGRVATPAIRSSATLGGSLAYAEAASDPAPALLCLEAEMSLAGPGGERRVPIRSFFTGFYETALAQGEIVTGVRVPAAAPGARSGYVKFCPRSAEDKPLIGVAAQIVLGARAGACSEVRIGLAGAAPTPIRAACAEAVLRGAELDDRSIRAAAGAAADEAEPLSDVMGSADYRRQMVGVWVRRLLTALRDGGPVPGTGR